MIVSDPCPADVDDDGEVDFVDLIRILVSWGPCEGCPEDIDADGEVDIVDLIALLNSWGPC